MLILVICLLIIIFFFGKDDHAVVGLVIAYAIPLPEVLLSGVRALAFLENKMISVERCHRYT